MAKPTPKVTTRKIIDYQPDPANPNAHTERGLQMLDNSLSAVGLGRSIVVDKNGIVLAGNSTQERAVDNGFEDAIEVESDGTKLVVVRRTDLDLSNDTDHRARNLSFYDNRAAELGIQWDIEQIQVQLDEGMDLSKLFAPYELNTLLAEMNGVNDPNAEWVGMPEFEQEHQLGLKQIIVHFNSEDDIKAFAELVKQPITMQTKYIWYPQQKDVRAGLVEDES